MPRRSRLPQIAPLVINGTEASLAKHDGGTDGNSEAPYSVDALARLVREAVRRIAGDLLREGALSYDAHAKLLVTSTHAFRHTFGTRAVARDMVIDVVQRILGHASLQTTSIYVHAERQRMLDAAAQTILKTAASCCQSTPTEEQGAAAVIQTLHRGGAVGSDSQIEFISGSAGVIKLPI
jgi:integrase